MPKKKNRAPKDEALDELPPEAVSGEEASEVTGGALGALGNPSNPGNLGNTTNLSNLANLNNTFNKG